MADPNYPPRTCAPMFNPLLHQNPNPISPPVQTRGVGRGARRGRGGAPGGPVRGEKL